MKAMKTSTVAEFMEFCINGRMDMSDPLASKGTEKYLEGGKDAGGQLVDQCSCPRIGKVGGMGGMQGGMSGMEYGRHGRPGGYGW